MNNLFSDLSEHLIKAHPEYELDTNLFVLTKPAAPDEIVVLTEYAGTGTANYTTTSVRSIQVLTRSRMNVTANEVAWKLYKTLIPANGILDLGEGRISIVTPRGTPIKLRTDAEGRHEWVFNIGITYNNDY